MNKTLFPILTFLIALSCTVKVTTETELESLNQTIDEFNSAFETCDITSLDRLTTDDYTHTNSASAAINKSSWMAYLKKRKAQLSSGQLEVTKYLFEERQVSLYDNSAWVTGVVLMDGVMDSTAFSRKIRVSHFWVKEDGQWKRAGFHDTRME